MRLNYKDSVILVDPVITGFGAEKIGRQETVNCLLTPVRGFSQGGYQQVIDADMVCYLDPNNSFVQEVSNRLEGMLVITNLGDSQSDAWYRIDSVSVGESKLLDNSLDNIQVNLKKSTAIANVS